jgi:TolB-like protein
VLEGSTERQGDSVRATGQLIDASERAKTVATKF